MADNSITCIVIDDEPLSLQLLESYIRTCEDTVLIQRFSNPVEALHYLQTHTPHLILLDVQMPELSGIQFAKIIQKKCLIVLTTAYTAYAVNAFDLDVVDYLLKPISYERFMQAINKVKEQLASRKGSAQPQAPPNYFYIKSEYKLLKIYFNDVLYLEGLRDYVAVHTRQGKLLTLQSLKSFEQELPDNFIRVHKSYMVNSSSITGITNGKLLLEKISIPIGAVYAHNLKDKIKHR